MKNRAELMFASRCSMVDGVVVQNRQRWDDVLMATTEQQRESERAAIRAGLAIVFTDAGKQRSDYHDRDFVLAMTALSIRSTINLAETIDSEPGTM